MKFFEDLPCTTVICISLLGGALASLLRELLNYPSSVNAWVLLSHLNMKSQPVVILLPVDSVLEGTLLLSEYGKFNTCNCQDPHYLLMYNLWILNKLQNFVQKFQMMMQAPSLEYTMNTKIWTNNGTLLGAPLWLMMQLLHLKRQWRRIIYHLQHFLQAIQRRTDCNGGHRERSLITTVLANC